MLQPVHGLYLTQHVYNQTLRNLNCKVTVTLFQLYVFLNRTGVEVAGVTSKAQTLRVHVTCPWGSVHTRRTSTLYPRIVPIDHQCEHSFGVNKILRHRGQDRDLAHRVGELCSYISALSCIFRYRSWQWTC